MFPALRSFINAARREFFVVGPPAAVNCDPVEHAEQRPPALRPTSGRLPSIAPSSPGPDSSRAAAGVYSMSARLHFPLSRAETRSSRRSVPRRARTERPIRRRPAAIPRSPAPAIEIASSHCRRSSSVTTDKALRVASVLRRASRGSRLDRSARPTASLPASSRRRSSRRSNRARGRCRPSIRVPAAAIARSTIPRWLGPDLADSRATPRMPAEPPDLELRLTRVAPPRIDHSAPSAEATSPRSRHDEHDRRAGTDLFDPAPDRPDQKKLAREDARVLARA